MDRADNLEKAIAAYEAALTVWTREALPREWASTQNNLGFAYASRIRGDRADNLEKAIAAYEAALTVCTREALPREWATTQNNLAARLLDAHPRRPGRQPGEGDRLISRRRLTVTNARGLAAATGRSTQSNLGSAYLTACAASGPTTSRRRSRPYEAALTVLTREALPQDWAMAQNNLGARAIAEPHARRPGRQPGEGDCCL